MHELRFWYLMTVVVGVLPMLPQSSPTRTRVDISKLGPQIGEAVPDFRLKDQNGTSWTLQSTMGPKGAMLVFFRSADW